MNYYIVNYMLYVNIEDVVENSYCICSDINTSYILYLNYVNILILFIYLVL